MISNTTNNGSYELRNLMIKGGHQVEKFRVVYSMPFALRR